MPIIKFSQGDILRGQVINEEGWHKLTLSSFKEGVASGSKKSLNYEVTFQMKEGKYAGKEFRIMYNTNMNNGSILGGTQFEPHFKLPELYQAIIGKPVSVDEAYDFENLIGKEVGGKIVPAATDGGGLTNAIAGFIPVDKIGEKPPF